VARIFFSTVSGLPNSKKLPCFYEGFVDALLREGNEVMLMITNDFLVDCWHTNKLLLNIQKDRLEDRIKKFNPDLVITFNNSLYEKIPELVTCPIAVWSADSPAMFSDKVAIQKNVHRYDFICATKDLYPAVKKFFNPDFKKVHTVYFATDFVAEALEQDKNITFIGTNFSHAANLKQLLLEYDEGEKKKRKNLIRFMASYRKDVLLSPEEHCKKLGIKTALLHSISHSDLLNLVSGNFRIQTLQSISDLGLELYGSKNWHDVLDFSLDLALCFTNQEISSVKENQTLYNQSKIAINITHAQAKNGFGWRVRDIMATNACVVSDYREELLTQFGEYVKIPVYHTPYEARELCQKLLKDELWRSEIVQGSQLAIEQGHRFKHRFADMEAIFGIQLLGNRSGKLVQLYAEDFMSDVAILQRTNELLVQKIQLLEGCSNNAAITWAYKMCARGLPMALKTRIKKWLL
jgi:hypothetical protein